ncbi:MAG: AAA family ATPase [Verrucomicrobia bacterium]|nr:MAG: AAA family ATPase [Verrucomicrobiota bacterium]
MQKILLIGSGGSGKSTLAARIAARTGLPLIHLDALFWKPGWKETPREEWKQIVVELLQRDSWVMDGNYGGTLDVRLAACDGVVFLDFPPAVCLWRLLKRRVQFHYRARPDMPTGCAERLSWSFLRWIWSYRRDRRPRILQKLATVATQGKQVHVLGSSAAVEAFLTQLPMLPNDAMEPTDYAIAAQPSVP